MNIKKHTLICFVLYIISLFISYMHNQGDKLELLLVAFITPWIMHIIFKLIKLRPLILFIYINWIFCGVSTIYGSTMGGYSFSWFDALLHFMSGIFFTFIAYLLYCMATKKVKEDKINMKYILVFFINGVNALVAVMWELYEYSLLVFLNIDAINHYSEGVRDAMNDFIVCIMGGLIITIMVLYANKSNKKIGIIKIVEEFLTLNNKEFK